MALRKAATASVQFAATRARTPRLYSLWASPAAGGWRRSSTAGVLGSAMAAHGLATTATVARARARVNRITVRLDYDVMKITRIETIVLTLPLSFDGATPMLGGRPRTSIDMLLVRVETDAGITGWGEAFGHRIFHATRAAVDTLLGPLCVGRDPGEILAINDDLQRLLHGVGRCGPTMYALSGIDIALWDIAGKVAGLPLYRLLGGSARADLPAYASLLRYGTAEAVAHYTEQALGRGYRHLKLHEITVPEVRAAREVAGPGLPIMLDTNCPWTVPQAVEMARRLTAFELHWLEEPVWPPENLVGLAEVRARGGIDVAAGENYGTVWEFRRAFETGALSYAQPSVTKIGGVTEMRRVMTLAEAFGVTVVPHSAYFGPGLLASIHCIAAMPTESLVERFYCDFGDNPLGDAVHPRQGRIAVPQGPGLGVDPDPRVLEKLRTG